MEKFDPERVATIEFLAAEDLEGAPWWTIYEHKVSYYQISEEEVAAARKKVLEGRGALKHVPNPVSAKVKTIMLSPSSEVCLAVTDPRGSLIIFALAIVVLPVVAFGLVHGFVHYKPFVDLWLALGQTQFVRAVVDFFAVWAPIFVNLALIMPFCFLPMYRHVFVAAPTHIVFSPMGFMAVRTTNTQMESGLELQLKKSIHTAQSYSPTYKHNYKYECIGGVLWSNLGRVSLIRVFGKTKDQIFCFHSVDGKKLKIKFRDLLGQGLKKELLNHIKQYAPRAVIDDDAYALLEPQPDVGYTELWISTLTAAPSRKRIAPLEIGATVGGGRYRILSELGAGGQGTAYVATVTDGNTGSGERSYVLKEYILPIGLGGDSTRKAVADLQNEARVLQRLNHPSIVKMMDVFIEDHRGYIVLERAQGKDLRTLVEQEGRLGEEQVRRLAATMCEILAYLHEQDPPLIHRDFTPDNLIFSDSGELKLIDFNVAQAHLQDNALAAIVVGKRSYMPPEQLRGKAKPASDIYALGASLYFLLTGEDPEPLSVLDARSCNADISEEFNELIARCTQLEVRDRFPTVADVRRELQT